MGLKCKISYDGGVAIVTDNNGNPSKLYSAALSITQNQELALNMWATAYSKEFGEKGEKADLEDLVKFMDATASTDSVLSPSEKFQVKDFMVRNGFTSLDQLYSELASIFKPNGYFDMDVKKAIDSGLYTEDEIRNLNPDAIDDILVKIEGNITVDDFKVSPATETEFYKNTDNKTIFGTYERVTREDIDKAILDSIEDFNDDLDFYNKISELPFTEFSDRFYNDEEFANTIINKFRGLKRIPNLHIDGETITDQDLSFYTTVKNTILSNIDTTSMEADIEYLDSIDQDIWESNDNLVVSVLNEVEMTFAEANIDVLGIRQNKHRRGEVMELLESALALAKNPSNENLNAYIQAHNQVIPKVDKQIAYRLPSKYDSYNIVRVFSNKSQDELYNKFGLIKVADNLYHKVNQNASPTAIAQEIYQQLKDKNIEIEELKDIDFDNKPKALASISEYLMLKPTESTITNKESYTGYQVVFNHDALPDTSEDVKQLADIRTDETYLKTKFISDFYNYVLFEKALDSDIYNKVLSKFSFTDSGIVLNDFVASIADVEYKTELQDYIRLKKDTNMKHLLPKVKGVLTEDVLYTNMPGKKSEYEGDFIMDQEFIITNPTADEFIKMDGQIYRKVLERENAHMFEMFIPNSVMFGEDANYYTTLTEAPSEIDRAREIFNQYGDTSPNAVDLTQFEETISRARLDDNLRSDLADLSTLKDPSYTFIINKLGVVAYKNGKRVGSIRTKYSDNQYSDAEISVAENHRGKGIGTELYIRFFDKISREDATFSPSDIRTKQAQNIYSRMEDMLEMQPDGSVKVRPQETEGVTWQQVADLEISQKELNNLRTSIRNRDKDSYTAEILDEVSKAMKGEDFNLPFELDFLADGITYNDVANLLMQDEIFETRAEIRNFISNRLTPPARPAFQEVLEPTKVYHVTNSYNIESINRDGLLTANEDGNFKNAKGESFDTKGKSYVFEDMNDALDWAVKMDLEANGSIGTGNISIVAIDKAGLEMQEDQALAGMAKMIGGPFGSSKFVTTNIPSSAIFGITRFDNKKNAKERLESMKPPGRPMFQEEATYKSNIELGLESISQKSATPKQWVKMIADNGGRGTNQELEWIGLEDSLNDWMSDNKAKSVPKSVVEDYVLESKVEVEEVIKDEPYWSGDYKEERGVTHTKYREYVLPGGEDYKEVLLTLPYKRVPQAELDRLNSLREDALYMGDNDRANYFYDRIEKLKKDTEGTTYKSPHWEEKNIVAHIRINDRLLSNGEKVLFIEEVQSDWAQQGRKTGFTSIEEIEKNKELVESYPRDKKARKDLLDSIDKLQDENMDHYMTIKNSEYRLGTNFSKDGKTKLYKEKDLRVGNMAKAKHITDFSSVPSEVKEAFDTLQKNVYKEKAEIDAKIKSIEDKYGTFYDYDTDEKMLSQPLKEGEATLDMPYKNTDQWAGLVMRRMMKMAADGGYDRVSWVTGEQSAQRYSLSKTAKEITVSPISIYRDVTIDMIEGGFNSFQVNNNAEITSGDFKGKTLSEVVGKDISEDIMKVQPGEMKVLSGKDLEVGGEGMKTFYNSILPKIAKKEAKRFDKDATVEVVDFSKGKAFRMWKGDDYIGSFDGEYISIDAAGNRTPVIPEGYKSPKEVAEEMGLDIDDLTIVYTFETENEKAAREQLSIPVTKKMKESLKKPIPLFQQQDPLGLINFYNYTPSSMMPNTNSLNKEEWEQMMSDLRSNRLSLVDYLNFTLTMQDEPIYQSIYKKLLEKNADIINFLEDQNEILKYEDPNNRDLLKAQKFVEFFEKYKDKTTNPGFFRWVQDNERFYKDVVKYLSGGSTRYQQENMDRLRIVPKEAFDAVTKRLEMTGLSPNAVVTDKQLFVRGLRDANKENRSQAVAKNVYGFTLDNTVFINKDKLNFNTAIHEFGHLWAAWARDVRKDLYDKGKELVKDSKYMDEVREKAKNPKSVYHNMNDEQLVEEALVTAIGDRGEAFINEKKKEGFLGWLQDLWDAISKAVGLTQMSTDAVQNLTLDEFAQAVAIDLLKGDTFQSAPYTITALTDPMIAKREGKMVNVQTIKQILKQAGTKQIEKDIIEEVLELEGFKGKDKIPFDDFKTQVNVRVMPLTVIESKSYSSYGSENVGTEADKFVTNIYNTDIDHGITGHFSADFRGEELKQQDLEIRLIDSTNGAKFAVVRKDVTLTEENLQDNVFNLFSNKEQAEQWIKDYNKSLPIKNQGLFGHTRVWTDTENKDVFVAELQSDTYQKKKLDDAIMTNYNIHPERINEKQKEFWDKLSAVRTLNTQVTLAKEVYDEGRFSPERKKYLGIGVLSKEISDFVSRSKRIPLDKNHKELLDNYVRLSEGKDIEMPSFDDSERVSTDTQRLFSNGIFVVEESGGTEGVYRLPFNSEIQKRTTTFRTINLTREDFIANGLENEEYLTSPDRNLMEILGALSENDKRYIFSEKMIPDSFVEIIRGLRGEGITVSRIKEILSDYQVIKDRKELLDLVDKTSEIYDRVTSSVGSIERGQLTDAQILRKQITKAQSENSSNLENLKRDLKIYQQYTLEGYKSSRLSTLIEELEALPQDKVIKLGKVKKSEYVLSIDLTKLDEFGISEAKMDILSGPRSMKSSNLNVLFELFKESLSGVIDPETYKEHYIGNRDKGKYVAGILDNMPVRDKQFVAHRKNYTDRLLREEIRRNAEKGMKTLSIPTPRTLALIEGYIQDEGQMPYTIDGRTEDDKSDLQAGDEIEYLGEIYVVVRAYGGDDTIDVADMSEVYERGKQSDFAERIAESEKEYLMSELEEFFRKNYRTVDSIYYADRPSMSNYEFSDNLLESPIGAIESIEGIGYTIKGTDEIAVFLPKSNNPTKKQAEDVLKDIVKDMVQEYDEEMPFKVRFIEGTLEEKNEARKKLQVLNMMDPDKKDKEVQSKIEALKNDIDNSSNFIDDISELHSELDASKQVGYYDGLSLSDIAKPVGTTIYGATIYEIDLDDSNLEETVKEHFKNKYNKEDSIYDYLYDQGYNVYQGVRDGETYFTAFDKRGMGTQNLKQPSEYETQSIEGFKIEDMQGYEKTILKKYEELTKKFKKERPDAEIINDANGNEWLKTNLTEDDGAKPVVAFQEEKTKDFEIAGEAIRQVDNLRKLIPENIQQKSQILSGKRELTEVGKKMGVEDYKPNRTDLEVASIFLTGNRFRTLDEREQNRVSQWADNWLNDAFIDEKKFDELAENYEDELGTDLFATEEEKQRESDITMGLIDLSKVGRDEFIIDFFKGDLFEAAEEARRRGMIKIPQSIIDRAREKSAKENVENISTIFDSQLELLNLYTPKEGNDIRRDIDSCGG
jgi:hypothetical protein